MENHQDPTGVTTMGDDISGILLGVLLYGALLGIGRVLKKKFRIGFGGMFQWFALVAGFYLAVWLPYRADTQYPHWFQGSSKICSALLILSGFAILARVVSRYLLGELLVRKTNVRVPKLIQDLAFAAVGIIGLFLAARVFFSVSITPFLTAGGVVAIILGLALQNLLSDLFAGIALQVEKPFKEGDWVLVGVVHGEVVEMNWRATRLRTNDNAYLIIPNSAIAKDAITNFYAPDRRHALRVTVGVDYDAEPAVVKKVLTQAAMEVEGVDSRRPPTVRITVFGDFSVTYEIKYWVDDHAKYQEYNDAVRTAVWYALKKANLKIPYPIREIRQKE